MALSGLRMPGKLAATSIVATAVLLSQGCQSVTEGLSGTEHAEITPFAQKAVEDAAF